MTGSIATILTIDIPINNESNNVDFSVTASIGIAMSPDDSQEPEKLVLLADKLCMKRNGVAGLLFAGTHS